jgi:hypothetical protein
VLSDYARWAADSLPLAAAISTTVAPRENACGYRVIWKGAAGRAKVTILIPFRDQIEMTQPCVAAIRRHTRGVAYEIVRLDNGSVSEKAEEFIAN